jgi:hypothetical protein
MLGEELASLGLNDRHHVNRFNKILTGTLTGEVIAYTLNRALATPAAHTDTGLLPSAPLWSARLGGMTIAIREEPGQPTMTELTGPLPDQAALGFCHGYAVGTCHYHTIAQQADLSQVCLEHIETAERMISQMQATIEFVSGRVRAAAGLRLSTASSLQRARLKTC